MHVQVWVERSNANFLSSWRASFYYVSSKNRWGGSDEIEKCCICHVRCGGCRRIRDRLGRAERSREEEESGSRAAAAPAGRVRRRTCSGVRYQGRPEVHLPQCLLGRERRREGFKARCMQSGQDGQRRQEGKEEKGVIEFSLNKRAAAHAAARFQFVPKVLFLARRNLQQVRDLFLGQGL